jgi:hypothetical protein
MDSEEETARESEDREADERRCESKAAAMLLGP